MDDAKDAILCLPFCTEFLPWRTILLLYCFFYPIELLSFILTMMLSRLIPSLAVVLALSTSASASEPRLRVNGVEEEAAQGLDVLDVDDEATAMKFHPKMEFSFDKSFQCRGATDPSKGGAGKKCEANMKKKVAVGLGPVEMASDMASDMGDLFQELMPSQEAFFPMEDDMEKMMAIDSDMATDLDELEDGASKTMKIGGFFKANWDCTVTWKKEGTLKVSKSVECGAKAVQGMGPAPDEPEHEVAFEEEF